MPRRTVAFLLAFSLASAGPALAQNAGDDQYTDPFAEEEAPAQTTPSSPSTPSTPSLSNTPPSSVQQATPSTAAPAPTPAPAAAAPVASAAAQLPATGSEPAVTLLLGGALVLAGAGLRLRFG